MNKPPVPEIPKLSNRVKKKENFRNLCKGEPVTTKEIAHIFGVTRQAVEKWVSAGLKPLGKAGTNNIYDSAYVTQWKIDKESLDLRIQLIEATTENENGMSGFEAKKRKEIAQALMAELDLEIRREQVANIEDIMEVVEENRIEIRAKLVSMASRLSGMLSHQDEESISKIIESEIKDTLEVLSNE